MTATRVEEADRKCPVLHTHLPVSKEEEDVRSQPGLLYSRACRYAAKPLYLPSSFFLYFLFLVTHDLNAFP